MGFLAAGAKVKVVVTSGVLRVTVRPQPTLASLTVSAALIVAFTATLLVSWKQSTLLVRAGEILGVLGAVFGWFQQLSGAEEQIEIGERGIRISREIFGWHRVSEFPIEPSRDLDFQTNKEDSRRLQFRFGKWRTIEFGNHMSDEQAQRVIDTLADALPEVARKLLPSLDITKHWTTLHLT
jgi:hypothetical protein